MTSSEPNMPKKRIRPMFYIGLKLLKIQIVYILQEFF
jgi:hypothetical protein